MEYLFLPITPFSFVCDMLGLFEFGTLSRAIVGPAGRTSSPNSSCKSLVIASLTSKFCGAESVSTLFTSKMMNISSFTDSPTAKLKRKHSQRVIDAARLKYYSLKFIKTKQSLECD